MAGFSKKAHAVHDVSGGPVLRVPQVDLEESLRARFRGRRGVELYEGLTTEEMDSVVIDAIPRDLVARETELMRSKWFDYRILHPWQATALFLEAYRSEHAWIMRKREDVTTHWFRKGISLAKLHNGSPTQLTSLWKARQAVDSICVPYDFFCRSLLDWAEQRNWSQLPRVNQLYAEEHVEVARELWEDGKRYRLRTATEPCYHRDAGEEWYQRDYRLFLVEQVRMRACKEFALASLLYQHEHLSENDVIQHFGHDALRRAQIVAVSTYNLSIKTSND